MSVLDQPWGFALGMGIGSAIGTFVGYKIFKKVIQKEETIEMEKMQDFYNDKIREILKSKSSVVEETPNAEEAFMKKVNQSAMEYSKNLEKERLEASKRDNVPFDALNENGEPKKVMDCQPQIKEANYKPYNKSYSMKCECGTIDNREDIKMDAYPHKITFDEWRKDANYKKVSLMYYELDSTFATLGDEPTDYTEEYFGIHNICEIGAATNSGMGHDAWMLYLRDELTKTDFEIYYNGNETFEQVLARIGGEK